MEKEKWHTVIHPESISRVLHMLSILTNHIETSQLDTRKSQVTGDYIRKKTYVVEIDLIYSKLRTQEHAQK